MPESEKFVMQVFLLKGSKILIKVAIIIVEYYKDKIMNARSFEEVYSVLNVGNLPEITPKVLTKALKNSLKIKLTNSHLNQ
jgi:hypothetical protein